MTKVNVAKVNVAKVNVARVNMTKGIRSKGIKSMGTWLNLKKSVESTTGAYCTESKALFTFLKLTHRVTWIASRKWIVSKKQKFALYSVH